MSARPRKPGKSGQIDGPWVAHRRALLESAAWQSLSLAARRVLDRLEIEHMQHAGLENGRLKTTYADLEAFGVRRASVSGALAELIATGLVRVTEQGRGGNAEYRRASCYRLTYLHAFGQEPTDEWASYTPSPLSRRDIECRRENASGPVGAISRPKTSPVGSENASGIGSENASGVLHFGGRAVG